MPTKTRIRVFDADSHILEPETVWTRYLDPAYRDRAQQSFWRSAGKDGPVTILNGKPVGDLSPSRIPRYAAWRPSSTAKDIGTSDPRKAQPPTPGASDPKARLHDMDAMGVDAALLFPTLFLEYLPVLADAEIAAALARAHNDWARDFASVSPKRLFPAAILPLQSVEMAVAEIRRTASLGFKAVVVRPHTFAGKPPTHPHYQPVWQAIEATGMVACIHPSCGTADAEMESASPFIERVSANLDLGHPVSEVIAPTMDNMAFLVGMMTEGLMERFPKLRTLFAHSGATWLPLALEKAETYLWLGAQEKPVSLEPEHVFAARQNAVTFDSREGSVRRLPDVFAKTAVWGSRYPWHDTGTPNEAVDDLKKSGVSQGEIQAMLAENAASLLHIEI